MKLRAVLAVVVLVCCTLSPAVCMRGQVSRHLLQDTNNTDDGYNYTLELLKLTNLTDITGCTIFAVDNKGWADFAKSLGFSNFDGLLPIFENNATVAMQQDEFMSNYVLEGRYMQANLTKPMDYTTLADTTLALYRNGTSVGGAWPHGPSCCYATDNVTFTILSYDHEWQGNVVHVIDWDEPLQ